jgi:predicted Zn-dependent protease
MSRARHPRLALVPGLALVGLSSLALAQLPEPTATVLLPMGEAKAALQAMELQVAESRYRSALLEGWLLMGALDVEEGDLESAKATYETSMTVAAESRRGKLALAAVYLKSGDPIESITLLRDIIRGNTKDL